MRPPLARSLALTITLGAFDSPCSSAPPNLVDDGEFDGEESVDAWTLRTPSISEVAWTSTDASGCGDLSGSALAANTAAPASATTAFDYCVDGILEGNVYSFGGLLRFPEDQATTGHAQVELAWLPLAGCFGESIDKVILETLESTETGWHRRRHGSADAPQDAISARLSVVLAKDQSAGSLDVRFDRFYMVDQPGFLFADEFELGSTCRWSLESPAP
jgi:hypothetical protein